MNTIKFIELIKNAEASSFEPCKVAQEIACNCGVDEAREIFRAAKSYFTNSVSLKFVSMVRDELVI